METLDAISAPEVYAFSARIIGKYKTTLQYDVCCT